MLSNNKQDEQIHAPYEETGASLPSRSDIYGKKKKQKKKKRKRTAKIKFPLLELLAVFFILLPIAFYWIYRYL